MVKVFLLTSILIIVTQCKTSDYLTPYEYTGRVLEFGTGGGFSGKVNSYSLLENGQVFKGTGKEGNVYALPKMDKKVVKQVFTNYDQLGFGEMELNSPGNLYYFLTMKKGDQFHKVMWGSHDGNEPAVLRVYHANLMKLVSAKNNPAPAKIEIK